MKRFHSVRTLLIYALYIMSVMSTFFCDTAFAIYHPDVRDHIVAYIAENRDNLLESMNTIEGWSEKYYLLSLREEEPGLVGGHIVDYPYGREFVFDADVNHFFAENEIVERIGYPANSDIIVFETDGIGNVTSSMDMGFYYSPQDKPAWINSEQLRLFSNETGKYMDYPMIQDGNGWAADTSVLNPYDADDQFLKDYGLYTDRICENFFYFESWY